MKYFVLVLAILLCGYEIFSLISALIKRKKERANLSSSSDEVKNIDKGDNNL